MSFGGLAGSGGGASASSGSSAGDVSAGLDFSLSTNNAFTFGGSGKVDAKSDASGAGKGVASNASALPPSQQSPDRKPLLLALGIVGVVAVASVLKDR